jgi:hypothetical protein
LKSKNLFVKHAKCFHYRLFDGKNDSLKKFKMNKKFYAVLKETLAALGVIPFQSPETPDSATMDLIQ